MASGPGSGDKKRRNIARLFRSLLPRFNLQSLFVIFGLQLVMLAVERAGRRADFTVYRHGWPFVYMVRDYRESQELQTQAHYSPNKWVGSSWPELDALWKRNGFPLPFERLLNPWAQDNVVYVNVWLAVIDAFTGLLLIMLVTKWLDRKRLFQFRLRTAIGLLTFAGAACAVVVNWRRGPDRDREILAAIKPFQWPGFTSDPSPNWFGWHPPAWIPESVAKIPVIAPWFERLDTIVLQTANPDALDRLARLPYLKTLDLYDDGPNGSAIEAVARLSQIESLTLSIDHFTADGLLPLSRLRRLKRLSIDGFAITDAVVDNLNSLKSLEEIEIQRTQCSRIHLHDLEALTSLKVIAVGEHVDFPAPLGEIFQLPPEKRPPGGFFNPSVRLTNLPRLKSIYFEAISLNQACLGDVCALPNLEDLQIAIWGDATSPEVARFEGNKTLATLDVSLVDSKEVMISDMSALKSIRCEGNCAKAVLKHLPTLATVDLSGNTKLSSIEVEEAPNVRDFTAGVNAENCFSGVPGFGPFNRVNGGGPAATQIRGLSSLSKLVRVNLSNCTMDPKILADLCGLTSLEHLDLTGTDLTDSQLAELKPLTKLRELGLGGTNVSLGGLAVLNEMPDLIRLRLPHQIAYRVGVEAPKVRAAHPTIIIDGDQ